MGVPRDRIHEVPAYMVEDEMMVMAAEGAHADTGKPTQDLIAKDMGR